MTATNAAITHVGFARLLDTSFGPFEFIVQAAELNLQNVDDDNLAGLLVGGALSANAIHDEPLRLFHIAAIARVYAKRKGGTFTDDEVIAGAQRFGERFNADGSRKAANEVPTEELYYPDRRPTDPGYVL